MEPLTEIDYIRSHEANVPWEGFKGALRELVHEGPLTVLFAAAVGAAIGGLMLLGAGLGSTSMEGLVTAAHGTANFLGMASAASAMLTTAFVATRGFLEGRHDALEKNQLVEHMADIHKSEVALRGKALQQEMSEAVAKQEGAAPQVIRNIIASGQRANPLRHAEKILAELKEPQQVDPRR